jgi:hypothetical protein
MARFSGTDKDGCARTSLGLLKIVPGCSSALMSKTLSSKAVVGRMVSSILRRSGDAARRLTRGTVQQWLNQAALASI